MDGHSSFSLEGTGQDIKGHLPLYPQPVEKVGNFPTFGLGGWKCYRVFGGKNPG